MTQHPSRALRVFIAGLVHETNSFSPLPTSLSNYVRDGYYRPPSPVWREDALAFAGYGDAVAAVRARGDEVIEGPFAWTQPSGATLAAVYQDLRESLLEALRAAGPVDVVLLVLHGAMVAEGVPDCEGDILMRVRDLVGPNVPVGAILDLHGNVGARMIESGAVLVGVKEYPHIDYRPRIDELYAMLAEMARRGTRLRTNLRTIPRLSVQGTTEAPMRDLVQYLIDQEGKDGVRSITLMHGFPWTDWIETGASVLIVSEATDPARIDQLADDIAERFLSVLSANPVERVSVAAAVGDALSAPPGAGPIIIADSSDNPGGGAAGDSTFLLRQLIESGAKDVALGMIWDPQAAQIAADAGVGARLSLRIGGKVSPMSGDPVDLEVEVLQMRSDVKQRFFSNEPNTPLGLAVALRAGGVDIVINSVRQQVFGPECFTELGIDIAQKRIVVVKSTNHFRALFDPVARGVIYCNAPGSVTTDLSQIPYRNLRLIANNEGYWSDRSVVRIHG